MISKLKHFVVNILSAFIRNKMKRKYFRQMLMQYRLVDVFHWFMFAHHKVKDNTVLLVETNSCHGEVTAGYIRYFQEIGYNVDILINSEILRENPFCRLDMKNVNIFHCYIPFFNSCFKSKNINNYNHVFLMTTAGYYIKNGDNEYSCVLDLWPAIKNVKSLFIVEHNLKDIERNNEQEFIDKGRLITIGNLSKGISAYPILLGDINITSKKEFTSFICVGSIKSSRKNHQELINAIEKLVKEGQKFKVVIVGAGEINNISDEVSKHIEIKGRLDFPKMFKEMEDADFFLPLLDPNNKDHDQYVTNGITGSALLIYEFGKIPVIHPKFASFYGFNDNNAIVEQDLANGMKKAIEMKQSDYSNLQINLLNLSNKLEKDTFYNLKAILK